MPKQRALRQFKAALFETLSHPVRIALLKQLRVGELEAQALIESLGQVAENEVADHLSVLVGNRILTRRVEGGRIYFQLSDSSLGAVVDLIHGGRHLHEISFLFVTCTIYAMIAFVARRLRNEKQTKIPKINMLMLSVSSILSTFTSVRSLRYVIYPVQVLAKSCKAVPVLLFGVLMGKSYPPRKFVTVAIITTGVILFMGGGSSSHTGGAETTYVGAAMLIVSLCFDGA